MLIRSLPTRECGLKCKHIRFVHIVHIVTPYAGVWIEICIFPANSVSCYVTPYAGVWIEIICIHIGCSIVRRHSLRGSVD